jgi:hypothetical protein
VQVHTHSFELNGTPEEVWQLFWTREPRRRESELATIEILHPGDDVGEGLVRHCWFKVPKLLLSGGVGQSWEWLTQVQPCESWRYDAVGKPLWSWATGFTRLEPLDDGRTRVHFEERYATFSPWWRRLGMERWVHKKLSRNNDVMLQALERGLDWIRSQHQAPGTAPADATSKPA